MLGACPGLRIANTGWGSAPAKTRRMRDVVRLSVTGLKPTHICACRGRQIYSYPSGSALHAPYNPHPPSIDTGRYSVQSYLSAAAIHVADIRCHTIVADDDTGVEMPELRCQGVATPSRHPSGCAAADRGTGGTG